MSSNAIHALGLGLAFLAALPAAAAQWHEEAGKKLRALRDAGVALAQKRCPAPIGVQSRSVKNTFAPEVTDTIQTISCPRMRVEIYRSNHAKPPRETVASLSLSDPDVALPYGLGLGTPRQAVENLFGKPDRAESERVSYYVPDEGPGDDAITFMFRNNQVSRIVMQFHVE
jgi:hypothetical protein